MSKERLSKLQKWILETCLKDLKINYQDRFAFFGKRHTKRKPEFWGEGHDLKKRLGEDYEKEFDIEKVKQERGGYVWEGLKINRKVEFCITNSEKTIISRSFKGLIKRGILIQTKESGGHRLTEGGFLKANK